MGPPEEGAGVQVERFSKESKGSKNPWEFYNQLYIHKYLFETSMLGYYSIFNKSRQVFADKFNSQQCFKRQGSSWNVCV